MRLGPDSFLGPINRLKVGLPLDRIALSVDNRDACGLVEDEGRIEGRGPKAKMKIAIPKELRDHETRVAASPETIRKYVALGAEVQIEKGAGAGASIPDQAFEEAGAKVAASAKAVLSGADLVLKVQRPIVGGAKDEAALLKKGAIVVAIVDPFRAGDDLAALAKRGITLFDMDFMPRITRAQSMDVLSSQANLAGYKAVIDGAATYGRAFPMMMTAAGTVHPAKVL